VEGVEHNGVVHEHIELQSIQAPSARLIGEVIGKEKKKRKKEKKNRQMEEEKKNNQKINK
jgi:hypothetical protein